MRGALAEKNATVVRTLARSGASGPTIGSIASLDQLTALRGLPHVGCDAGQQFLLGLTRFDGPCPSKRGNLNRHQIVPDLTRGAEVMDQIFG